MIWLRSFSFGLCLLCALSASFSVSAGELSVSEIEWRAPIPGQSVGVVYLTIDNSLDRDVRFQVIDVTWAKKAEFHTHSHEQGMMKMRQVDQVLVEAGTKQALNPGGLHIMVFGVDDVAAKARDLLIELVSDQGDRVEVRLPSGNV